MTTEGPPPPRDFPELGDIQLYAPPEPPARPEPPSRRPGIQVAHSFGPPADSPQFRTGQLPERPAWDRVIIPSADPGFLRFIADHGVGVVAVFRLPDAGHTVIWRRAQDDPGRYTLTSFWPSADGDWFPSKSRERMDIWAAYEEVARLVVRKAARPRDAVRCVVDPAHGLQPVASVSDDGVTTWYSLACGHGIRSKG